MHWIDYVVVVIPVFVVLYIGFKCQKYVRGVTDFLAAGRVAKRYVLSVASFETGMGLITVVAVPESNYLCGFAVSFWYNLIMPITIILSLTGYCQYRYRETRAMTMGQFLEMRYSRGFRVFASMAQALSGILNYAIFPAVASRFLIYFLDLPHRINIGNFEISMYALMMFARLAIAVLICLLGGQITIMVTDCIQGILSYPMYVIIVGYLIYRFSLNGEMIPALANRVPGESFLNPYDTKELRDMLPVGITGIFCAMMLFMLMSTDTTYMHSRGTYFNFTQVYVIGVIGIVSTVWFMWGGIKDLRSLFRDLSAREQITDEDGSVER